MSWSIAATLLGVIVTAVLGTLAIVREQSVIRQLERVTAVLKDSDADAVGRDHLEWLRGDLARRLNYQYRAPRRRFTLFFGWFSLLFALGNLVWLYCTAAFALGDWLGKSGDDTWQAWAGVGLLILVSVGLARQAYRSLVRRARRRVRWILRNSAQKSRAPFI